MKICRGSRLFDGPSRGLITIGIFDGFHLGHQKLIQRTIQQARQNRLPSILYSFDPHPLEVLNPERGVRRLFPIEHLMDQVKVLGLDYFVVENFSKDFSKLPGQSFFDQYIFNIFHPSRIVVGSNFRFGFKRGEGVSKLKEWQDQYHFRLETIESVKIINTVVSSSILRQSYENCDFSFIRQLLGRPFSIKAKVVTGRGRGRKIGFPTANLKTNSVLPKKGVYVCQMKVKDSYFQGVMNIGINPTFEKNPASVLKVEVHLIEPVSFDLKGEKIEVDVLSYLRSEKKFNNPEQLSQAIQLDVKKAQQYFLNQKS